MPGPILLDTCAVIWIAEGDRMEDAAKRSIEQAAENGEAYVSTMTAWEIGMLISRGRLSSPISPQAWFRRFLDLPGIALTQPQPDVMIASSFLPGEPPRDPVDRILIATARDLGLPLVTRDRTILDYAERGHVHSIGC